jgi:hypothetical protein
MFLDDIYCLLLLCCGMFLMCVTLCYKHVQVVQAVRTDGSSRITLFGPEMYGQSRELSDYIGAQPMWSRCVG